MNDKKIIIEGKGLPWHIIASQYESYITSHFHLTVDDIVEFFGCTYLYALKNIRPYVEHISINTVARKLIFRSHNEICEWEEETLELAKKRILFNDEDFRDFVRTNVKKEIKYGHIPFSEFEDKEEYQFILRNYDKNKETPFAVLNKAANKLYKEFKKGIVSKELESVPGKLYSLKELKEYMGYRHDMEVRRLVESRGANKHSYGNLIRYDVNEVVSNSIPIPIDVYQKKPHGILVKEIISESKDTLIRRKK
ncbi:hypothetical protein EEL30_00175 (plasmid) [Brevibacillus laterosporus]|uniref:Uncharacterized protein n=1 Tax=Brevibacillus laterosporus TaxID=1465 RepID=A0A518V1S4_BRELA|nr:hypothetical protein EEL30_00175 [Brevibacillus laterosporus]